jgi:hypothetical protein
MTDTNNLATSGPSVMTSTAPPACTREVAETIFGNFTTAFSLKGQKSPTMHDDTRQEGIFE